MFQTLLALQQGLILPPEFVCFILSGPLPVLFVSPVFSLSLWLVPLFCLVVVVVMLKFWYFFLMRVSSQQHPAAPRAGLAEKIFDWRRCRPTAMCRPTSKVRHKIIFAKKDFQNYICVSNDTCLLRSGEFRKATILDVDGNRSMGRQSVNETCLRHYT